MRLSVLPAPVLGLYLVYLVPEEGEEGEAIPLHKVQLGLDIPARIRAPMRFEPQSLNLLLNRLCTWWFSDQPPPLFVDLINSLTREIHQESTLLYRACQSTQATNNIFGGMPVSPTRTRELLESRVSTAFSSDPERAGYTLTKIRDRDRCAAVSIQTGDLRTWVGALSALTLLRKRMFDANLEKGFAHTRTPDDTHHNFTSVNLDNRPTGVWIYNTKAKDGGGTSRVIGFVEWTDEETGTGRMSSPVVRDLVNALGQKTVLWTLDASYEEVFAMLAHLRRQRPFCVGNADKQLATYLLSFLNGNIGANLRRQCRDVTITVDVKAKHLLDPGKFKMMRLQIGLDQVCMTTLSILFLTEPRHALPMWVSNYDALCCIAEGTLTFDEVFGTEMTFDSACRTLQLVPDEALGKARSLGGLLASRNTAATFLSPTIRHTRKLKELIMPVTEFMFKQGVIADLPTLQELIRNQLTLYREEQNFFGPLNRSLPWYDPVADAFPVTATILPSVSSSTAVLEEKEEKEQVTEISSSQPPMDLKAERELRKKQKQLAKKMRVEKSKQRELVISSTPPQPLSWEGLPSGSDSRTAASNALLALNSTRDGWGRSKVRMDYPALMALARQQAFYAPVLKVLLLRLLRGRHASALEQLIELALKKPEKH